MSKRTSTARYTLPLEVDPPTRVCFQIEVPNDIYHIGAFLGQIYALSRAFSWGNDASHTALDVARVWRDIFDNLKPGCPQPASGSAGVDTEELLIRQNPDNPCLLETSINGTDWCVFADLSKCVPGGSQPGSGTPQPPANGGEACYHASFEGSNKWLLPTLVNAGDVVQISNAHGAASDGTVVWYCPNGAVFQLGACFGSGTTSGGDPLNTSPHMMLIAKIGSTYYPMYNTTFTVPGGVSAASVEFQLNDSNLADNYGNITFDVCVTNNAAGAWTHVFDFTLSDYGWITQAFAVGTPGAYTPGVGWVNGDSQNPAANYYRGVAIQKSMASRTVTDMQMTYDISGLNTDASLTNHAVNLVAGGTEEAFVTFNSLVNATGQILTWHGSKTGCTSLAMEAFSSYFVLSATYQGSSRITKLIVSGLGTDPF